MFLTIITFIIILGILVLVHELGHFFTARANGIKVEEFGLGLPPRLLGIRNVGSKREIFWGRKVKAEESQNTIYSLNWLPLGGFVKIRGEDGAYEDESDSFGAKKIWQRISVLASGVSMNIVLAFVLLAIVFAIGVPTVPWYQAIWRGVTETFFLIKEIFKAIGNAVSSIWSDKGPGLDVAGPVGIAMLTGQVVRLGIVYILQFAALLSINLAIINILPLPALDGGRILFLVIEKIRRKPVNRNIEGLVHNIGLWVLILLIAVITVRDVFKLF